MDRQTAAAGQGRTQVFFMIIAALLFGYFGFATQWLTTSATTGQFLLFVALLEWTLKIAAVVFGLSAIISFVAPALGNLLYAVTGLASALMFVAIAIMDFLDTQHTALSPLILLLFAAWNGYGSWVALHEILSARRVMPYGSGDADAPA